MPFMKIWGYEAYIRCQISNKLWPKLDKCFFVGYPKQTKRYYFNNLDEGKVVVARTGIFLEREFISRGTSGRKIEFKEVREP